MADPLRGLGVGPGLAAGIVLPMGAPPELPPPRPVTDPGRELDAALAALESVRADLAGRAAAAPGKAARDVLEAQAAIAADPMLETDLGVRTQRGEDAAHALHGTFDEYRRVLLDAGDHLAERAADLADIADRAVAAALGRPMPGVPAPGHPFILAAGDLSPADTATLDPSTVLALVTERGGPTSHTAILARALGLPAVVGCAGLLDAVAPGALGTVDGTTGEVRIGVGADEADAFRGRAAALRARPGRGPAGPGRTADGHPVDLMLNIGSAADLDGVDLTGVAGVGLFRTELLFLERREEPGLDQQVRAYREVFDAVGERVVVVRTLDAGADKPLPFLGLPEEPNPALGVRGFRTVRLRPEVLETQLEAIVLAAEGTAARVAVMAPMISTPGEAADFAGRAARHGLPGAGVMVEVPAAALSAAALLRVAGFLSIGTNDLGQYALAADRQGGDLPDLLDPWQPALLRLIAMCTRAGLAAGKSVGVCGEAAGDPLLAPVLAGLGVGRLSMSARSMPPVRDALARHDLAGCERLAGRALAAASAEEARTAAAAGATVREG
ncbi:phosphoenolpyruvate--protein phosphotransferase [Actinomadura xylanilytica]|uniref:phosphoenolpyruvate--protein phosphotransferase n=1 Tax=Actinomadura xylanilytica TaxID=887459 RepID=UPI00255B1252|nr:phosphoenolpyruvate--protein phosphotransferase [Actinomadura xylanilytica]MDL4771863.1 phosphoenolpyruvate--protein phosphotransferase [Actinomadura xylanilytica]